MNIEELKKDIANKINQIEDEKTLHELDHIVSELVSGESDFWEHLPEQVKLDITKAENELKEGKGIPHEQVVAEMKLRYKDL